MTIRNIMLSLKNDNHLILFSYFSKLNSLHNPTLKMAKIIKLLK